MLDAAGPGDAFGWSLTVGGFNGDRYADLAIGIPLEHVPQTAGYCGTVSVVFGSGVGLVTDGNQFWDQDSPGIQDECQTAQSLGTAIAALPPIKLFLDDFETGDTSRWMIVLP